MTVRCPVCVTRRATRVSLMKHQEASGHYHPCTCPGYHFPHRPGSPRCDENPYRRYHCARTEGCSAEEQLDAFIEDTLYNSHKPAMRFPE